MPNYDLYCPDCEHEFRAWATIAEKTEKQIKCPQCAATSLETVFKAAPAVISRDATAKCPQSCAGCQFA